jgi:hypothetical protein
VREGERERGRERVRVLLTCFSEKKGFLSRKKREKKREREKKDQLVFLCVFFIACLIKGKGIFWCH